MGTLLSLLVLAVVLGLLYYLITLLPLPAPFAVIVQVIFLIICILVSLSYLGFGSDLGFGRPRF